MRHGPCQASNGPGRSNAIRGATTRSKPTTRSTTTSNATTRSAILGSQPSISRMAINSTTTSNTISNRPTIAKVAKIIAKIGVRR